MSVDVNTRQRLRPWLEAKINSGQIQGLEWINREQHIFKVPWKHGGKHDWNEQDSQIFKEWAVHTGRYREGVDDPDWPTWKTRFRCALNKLPDIQEVKDLSKLDGSDPFRAYRFIPRKGLSQTHRTSLSSRNEDMEHHLPHSSLPDILNNVPGSENRPPNGLSPNLPSDLTDIDFSQFVGTVSMKTEPMEDMDTSSDCMIFNGQMGITDGSYRERSPGTAIPLLRTGANASQGPTASSPNHFQPEIYEMRIKLRYRDLEAAEHIVTNPRGCRLFYGPRINEMDTDFNREYTRQNFEIVTGSYAQQGMSTFLIGTCIARQNGEIYGPDGVDLLHFPLCLNKITNRKQEDLTVRLLDVLDRGLVLENEDGDIYATRKCRCVIFVALPHSQGDPIKLKRDQRVKIFDYKNYFEPMLYRYAYGRAPRPSAEVLIGFGQKWVASTMPYNNILISATVYQSMAQYRLDQVTCTSPLSPPIERSKSDDIDKFLDQYKHVEGARNGFPLQTASESTMCV